MILKRWIEVLKFSLSAKLNFIMGIIVCLFIVFSIYNNALLDRFSTEHEKRVNLYNSILELKHTFNNSDIAINEYFRSGNRTNLAEFNNLSNNVRIILVELSYKMESDEQIYLLQSIDNSFKSYYSESSNASFLYNRNNYEYYDKMFYAHKINKYLLRYSDELLELVLEESVIANTKLTNMQKVLSFWNGVVIVSLVFFFLSCITYINVNVTKPLNALSNQAKEISRGNFNVKVEVKNSQNTIGILSKAFNGMVKNIKEMMESIQENIKVEKQLLEEQRKNVEYKELLNQATFLALQTQTNPHFLFNTLNSISRTITFGKNDQAIKMIDSLATLLRYNLEDAEVSVTLEEEINITKEYLNIQKFRFSDRIQAEILCEDDIEKTLMIPRFTLQPLVENAIIHGLEPKEEGGKIRIIVKREGHHGIIKIIDNGLGISKSKLEKIKNNTIEGPTKSIGLKNTQQRIQIFTGCEQSFQIKSKEKMGTIVKISLLLTEENDV
ncbi:histidine kinase/DNA gyrase B/HSP90-like ATPase [Natranaerovirga pectinivora]|uniref:Histidine kinase/DNA gyrase B/HSP90-like ATPase n=1 Tax=Natranaerovirga pectinivora TaxID=682400 RepID=A0A4R3MMQ3_9FIRM|nr:histidine kinase [Natranaerovirga pectinivora]TCT16245.1 histidine kinase/DNA gyrase B/HSP90-like ATPase [Natranaerovirga pectinivora]